MSIEGQPIRNQPIGGSILYLSASVFEDAIVAILGDNRIFSPP
jgi:hypothetical protein